VHVSARDLPVKVYASDNAAMLRAFSADPLVIKDTRTEAVVGLVDLMGAALDAGRRLTIPTLVLYGRKDEIVPRGPVARFVEELPGVDRSRQRVALYPQGYHMLLRDLDAGLVVDDVATWLLHPVEPLPSHADLGARFALTGQRDLVAAR
jgi:alpha-beta hydrolase superfamily lysophospholipase